MSLLSVLTTLFIFTATTLACSRNETKGFILSCEYTCRDLRESCRIESACVCNRSLYRDIRTQTCVEKEKCPNYTSLYIRAQIQHFFTLIWNFIQYFLPGPIRNAINLLVVAYHARKFVMNLRP